MNNQPQFPIYIVSKGRHKTRFTSKALENMGVPYYIIVEEQEYDDYCSVIDKEKVLILPKEKYHSEYDVCDDLGLTKSPGPGPARNFAWDHAIANGHKWHWVMDDNITRFCRYNNNQIITAGNGAVIRAMEDFVLRYENVAMAGPNYFMFIARKQKYPPFVMNTRIYSCNLIRNDVPFRWRGRYNEDTDLSLRMLKADYCTIQFNAFLQEKTTTQVLKGGNTDAFYEKEGTAPKSKMLVEMHPDVARISFRFNRWHHHVDYTGFKKTKLIKKKGQQQGAKVNNYGMTVKQIHGKTNTQTKAHSQKL